MEHIFESLKGKNEGNKSYEYVATGKMRKTFMKTK